MKVPTLSEKERMEEERMHDVLLLLKHLLEREEVTAKLILDCLYDVGSVNLIDKKFRFRPLNRTLKPIARMSKPVFRVFALHWFKKNCPQLITDWLHSQVSFNNLEDQSSEKLVSEVSEIPAEERSREIKLLRSQVRMLTGILLAAIAVFGGSFIWLFYSLKLEPLQLTQQIQSTTASKQELESFESEVKRLFIK